MLAGVAPFGIETGMIEAADGETHVMIFNVKQGVKFDPALFKINTQRLREFNQGGTQR